MLNKKGTIAMAEQTALIQTSQFFINLRDNEFLDESKCCRWIWVLCFWTSH